MILSGDIGGTKVRLAFFEEGGGRILVDEQRFASREFSDFSTLLKQYLRDKREKKISSACFGIAGPVRGGVCKATNLPWEISAADIEKGLNIPKVHLINDLEANAWGLNELSPEEFYVVNVGVQEKGHKALISAGTGLGEAGIFWDGKSHHPFACEGGHSDFAPTDDDEIELLKYLMRLYKHVSYERVLSGPGLYQIYRFLIDTAREEESSTVAALMQQGDGPQIISEKGASGECRACARACRMFIEIYGAEAGNVALKFFAVGGVFLGGGIIPNLLPFIKEGNFIKTFIDKGRLSSVLLQIPVKVVLNVKTGLLGAARFARENR